MSKDLQDQMSTSTPEETEETEVLSAWDIMAQEDIVQEPIIAISSDETTDETANETAAGDDTADSEAIPTRATPVSADNAHPAQATQQSDLDQSNSTDANTNTEHETDTHSDNEADEAATSTQSDANNEPLDDADGDSTAIEAATVETSLTAQEIEQDLSDPMVNLRRYPSLALEHITVLQRKTHTAVLDDVSFDFFARKTHSILVRDNEQRAALLGIISGLVAPHSGTVTFKSQPLAEITRHDWRGHFLGLITQRFGLLSNTSARDNLVYTMQSSGRNFLKTMPLVADDVLREVGFDLTRNTMPVKELHAWERALVQCAKALCCEPNIVLADEPTLQLGEDGSAQVITTIWDIAKHRDCTVIVITSDADIAQQADIQYGL